MISRCSCLLIVVIVAVCMSVDLPVGAWQVDVLNQKKAAGDQASLGPILSQVGPQNAPQQPWFVPLQPVLQQRVEKLLAFWENSSSQIQRYQCDFTRWRYDERMCNWRNPQNNHLAAMAISKGKIRYSTPDKGMYEVLQRWRFAGPPEKPGGIPQYQIAPDESEKWICDGKSMYEFDFQNKRLYDLELPPEAQGEGLKNSPLPFVFGAKAADLLERYWVREATPAKVEDQFWIEAWPKRTSDAQAYKKVEIILSRDPFLPQSIHIYAPNYDEKMNPSKVVFEFEGRQINGRLTWLQEFIGHFIRPETPRGWKRVQKKLGQDPGAAQVPQVGQGPTGQNSK